MLGPLALAPAEGPVVSPGGPKQRELLSLLLLHRGAPLSADRLVDALWGDDPPTGAEVTLRSHVSHLRRRLAETLPGCAIETGPQGYSLAAGELRVDADVFAELLGRGQEAFGLGRPDDAAGLLRDALSLWRGDAWSEIEHLDAAMADASRLAELRLVAHEVLVAAELARGRHRDVVAEVEALHAAHPFRERFAGQLMLAMYRSGRQADALAVYAATREQLADELGLDPGPELQALSQAILRQDPSLDAEATTGPPTTHPARPREVSDGVLSALVGSPLDGRTVERDLLVGAWRSVVDTGAPRLLLVSGEAGIGKSRLVAELVAQAVEDGGTVLVGRCDGTDAAYHPVTEALRSSRSAQAALTAPLEQLVGRAAGDDPVPGFGDGHPPAYAAMRSLLERLSGAAPTLLVVEDAEGIDRASSRLLRHLAARLPDRSALVVAYRDPPGGRHPALLELLGDVGLRALTEHVVLGPLDEESTGDLVRRALPAADADAVRRLWQHTGGNPYFVSEVARSWAGGDDLGVPPALRDVLVQRLASASGACRDVLAAAAVLGRDVDLGLVTQVVAKDEDEVAAALEEAVAAGFLVEAGGSWTTGYAFPHELMREATERDLTGTARRRLHRRAADAIAAAAPGAGRSAVVARHLQAAGHLAEPAERADWLLRAAREARALQAWDEAVQHAERAVEMLAGLPERAAYAEAAEETARLRIRSSRGYDRVVALREAALAVHVELGDREQIGRAHGRLGTALSLHHSALDVPRALEHLDAAERLLGDALSVHTGRTQAAMFGVRTTLLEDASSAVLSVAESSRRPDLFVAAGWARGWALFNRGELAAGRASDDETWALAHEQADSFLGWSAAQAPAIRETIYLLDPAAGRAWCRRALGQPRFAAMAHSHETIVDQLGLALLASGDTAAAREVTGSLPATALSSRLLRMYDGHWQEAESDWATALDADESAGDLHDAAVNALWLAEVRELLGDEAGAVDTLRRAAEIGAAGPQVPVELAARAELARILASPDELERCFEILAGGEDYRGRAGRVHLAAAHVRRDDAVASLDAADAVFHRYGLVRQLEQAAVARARLLPSTPLPHPPANLVP